MSRVARFVSQEVAFALVFFTMALSAFALGENVSATRTGNGSATQVQHIIWMLQENRSFDNYFGMLNNYRVAHSLPANNNAARAALGHPAAEFRTPQAEFITQHE